MKKSTALLIVLLLVPGVLFSQQYEWLQGGTYDAAIPTPESTLGYEIGDYLTDHHQMIEYIHKLAASTDRVRIFKFGTSVERRDMYLIVIGSEENMSRLDDIRTTIAKLTDPRTTSDAEAAEIARNTPPIGWMNYGIDGNESAAFECAMQLAYQLAAGTDPLTRKIRGNIITIINPIMNPESHQRYVTWFKAAVTGKKGTADPYASEHNGDWLMSTNNNHYDIDLNRDGFALTQNETQLTAAVMHHWNPQVWVDNHGETTEYFFAPFVSPVNLNYPPSLLKWATEVGRNNAHHFDTYGWTFFKDETFDIYYPGYWDSYPAFSGAVAMTYETDGGGRKGFVLERSDNTKVTLRDGIHHHFIADMATLEVLADNREEILGDFYAFRKTGMTEADTEQFKAYVLMPGEDRGRLCDLLNLLDRHQIQVFKTDGRLTSKKAQTYFDRTPRSMEFPEGSFVIPLKQSQKRLVKVLFEPNPRMEDKFMKIIDETRARNKKLGKNIPKEGLGFYDVTAWALPLTFGIDAAFTEDVLNVPMDKPVGLDQKPGGGIEGGRAGYAYLFTYNTDGGAKLCARLLDEGYNVALALKEFRNSDRDYPRGTLFSRVERNPESLHERIGQLAEQYGVNVHAVNTAWAERGISLGSNFVRNLKKPRVMALTNQPVGQTAYGALWFILEQRFEIPFTPVRTEYFGRIDLARYNVIIFPDGSAANYERMLGKTGVEKLKNWISAGGVFVGIKGGAEFALRDDVKFADIEIIREIPAKNTGGQDTLKTPLDNMPGSIFRASVNTDYYLGFGYPEEIAVQVRGNRFFSKTVNGANVITFPENAHLMGHTWEYTAEVIKDKLYLADVPLGQGHVILYANDPTFRLYWQGLDRLLLSSILFAPAMKRETTRY